MLDIERDLGYAETFQYVKEGLVAAVLAIIALRRRQATFLIWGALFGYLLVDDAMQVHEKVGELLGRSLGLGQLFGLKPADFGEAIVAAGVVCVFLPLLAVGYRYGDGEARRGSRGLLVLLFLLAFIGVGLDLVRSAVIAIPVPYAAFALGIAEDGGEMLIMSAIVTDVRYLWGRTPRQRHRGSVTGTG